MRGEVAGDIMSPHISTGQLETRIVLDKQNVRSDQRFPPTRFRSSRPSLILTGSFRHTGLCLSPW